MKKNKLGRKAIQEKMDGQRIGTGYSQQRRPETAIDIVVSCVMPGHTRQTVCGGVGSVAGNADSLMGPVGV